MDLTVFPAGTGPSSAFLWGLGPLSRRGGGAQVGLGGRSSRASHWERLAVVPAWTAVCCVTLSHILPSLDRRVPAGQRKEWDEVISKQASLQAWTVSCLVVPQRGKQAPGIRLHAWLTFGAVGGFGPRGPGFSKSPKISARRRLQRVIMPPSPGKL